MTLSLPSLHTFFTQGAGVIHTDFERGFIKAEVVAFDDFKVRGAGRRT